MSFTCWETGSGDNTPIQSRASANADVLKSPPLAAAAYCLLRVVRGRGALWPHLVAALGFTLSRVLGAGASAGVGLGAPVAPTGGVVSGLGGASEVLGCGVEGHLAWGR